MSGFLDKIWGRKEVVNLEKQQCEALLSTRHSQYDKSLILATLDSESIDLKAYLKQSLNVDTSQSHPLSSEITLLSEFIGCKMLMQPDVNVKVDIAEELFVAQHPIQPFVLFPMVQNALVNGYLQMEKFPIRIRVHLNGNTLKMEVSNRMNHNLLNQVDNDYIKYFKSLLEVHYAPQYSLFLNSNSSLFKATLLLKLV